MTQTRIEEEDWHLATYAGDGDASNGDYCSAREETGQWVCTRCAGHDGPHIAHASVDIWCAAWYDCDPDYIVDEGL